MLESKKQRRTAAFGDLFVENYCSDGGLITLPSSDRRGLTEINSHLRGYRPAHRPKTSLAYFAYPSFPQIISVGRQRLHF